jgi:hypothetical protein
MSATDASTSPSPAPPAEVATARRPFAAPPGPLFSRQFTGREILVIAVEAGRGESTVRRALAGVGGDHATAAVRAAVQRLGWSDK